MIRGTTTSRKGKRTPVPLKAPSDTDKRFLSQLTVQEREAIFLAPYAVKSFRTRGRVYPEKESNFRTPYQRDRDRVIHPRLSGACSINPGFRQS